MTGRHLDETFLGTACNFAFLPGCFEPKWQFTSRVQSVHAAAFSELAVARCACLGLGRFVARQDFTFLTPADVRRVAKQLSVSARRSCVNTFSKVSAQTSFLLQSQCYMHVSCDSDSLYEHRAQVRGAPSALTATARSEPSVARPAAGPRRPERPGSEAHGGPRSPAEAHRAWCHDRMARIHSQPKVLLLVFCFPVHVAL